MAQSIRFKEDAAIIRTLDAAMDAGINTFMCTTHDRIGNICDIIRSQPGKYSDFKIFPCMPYAHKYANAVTELGITGALKAICSWELSGFTIQRRCSISVQGFPLNHGTAD